jgi:hypothetical protein
MDFDLVRKKLQISSSRLVELAFKISVSNLVSKNTKDKIMLYKKKYE